MYSLRSGVTNYFRLPFFIVLIILSMAFAASATDITVVWDANSESDIAGYILFYGTSSSNYSNSIDVGNNTQYTLSDLIDGTTYYFAAKAYDTANNKSDYSEELIYTLPAANSAPNTPSKPTGPSNGFIQTSYEFSTSGADPEGDSLEYRFNWGDGNISAWGSAHSVMHTFSSVGTYCIKAQSQDTHGAFSAWSECLNVSIDIQTYTISASANLNGSISPSGLVTVNNGAVQSFFIIPNQNYHVADVVVDGSSVGSVTTYNFNNVDCNHTIIASFAMDNQPPLSNAGTDNTGWVSDTVQLDGSGSSDVDGDSLTFKWSFASRPAGSNATLSDTTAVKPTFVVDVAGTYTLQLVVNDGAVNSAPDTVIITTKNSAPLSKAGSDQAILVNDTVQLDGSGSSDVDGDSLTFKWSFASRPTGSNATLSDTTAVKPTFEVDVAGSYTVQLIVNDGTVNSTPDTVTISTENSAPVSDAGNDQAVLVNDTVQLDGSGSSDVDGDPLTFKWSLVSKPEGSNAMLYDTTVVKPIFDVDVAGSYTVKLIVNDGTVNSTPDTVTISTENSAPVSDAGDDQAALVNDSLQLDGSGSSDVDGDSLTFKWSFASRPTGSNATLSDTTALKPTFEVDVAGSYTVQLIVNDGTVNSTPDTVTISTENSAPVSDAGNDQAVLVNDTVQLDGSGSSDVDGDSLTFKWSFASRPTGSNATLSDTTAVKPTFEVDVAGSYTVQLIVNDGTVNGTPDTVTISTENSAPVSDAGNDQAVLVNDTVQLDGSGSSDVDSDMLTFKWSFVYKPSDSNATLSKSNVNRPTFVLDIAGTYTLQLLVNDGTVNSAPDTISISTENSTPVSYAGEDQALLVNDTVELDGTGSSDADGDTLTFKWSFVSRPSDSIAMLSDNEDLKPTFEVDVAGTYILQLIVNDGTDNSTPDTVTIITKNSAPVSNAGTDQTVEEGTTVLLNGSVSTDPDHNIADYAWNQIGGSAVILSAPDESETNFIAPQVLTNGEQLTFKLTVTDAGGLSDTDTCVIEITKPAAVDSDSDGVPDDQDAFPSDPTETIDSVDDSPGNNADPDDDNDGMADIWEQSNGLDPLKDDASADLDGDGISNLDEYLSETNSTQDHDSLSPDAPVLISPYDNDLVALRPTLVVDEFYDPDIGDVHSETEWQIFWMLNKNSKCVLELRSSTALTSLEVPSLVLDAKKDFSWRVRFYDDHSQASEWSVFGYFTTLQNISDLNENGVPDSQEVDPNVDLDGNGIPDADELNIKNVKVKDKKDKLIGLGTHDAPKAVNIISLQSTDPSDQQLYPEMTAPPGIMPFGLIDFKVLVETPGDQAELTIYFSQEVPPGSVWYKYDSVQNTWIEFYDYAVLSPNRMSLTLYLQDGGPGDADGVANGLIVDPSGLVSPSSLDTSALENDSSVSSGSNGCFINSLQ